MVQLATATSALVVHLAKMSGRPSRACAPLIESVCLDEQIVKAGCSIDQDFMELCAEWKGGLEARSRLDLGGIGGTNGAVLGLKTLCANVLQVDLPKSRRLAMSDWSQMPLSDAQIAYCARDAWAGAAVTAELRALAPEMFSPSAIFNRLKSQRPVKDLMERQQNRKQAKELIRSFFTKGTASSTKTKSLRAVRRHDELPPWKQAIVQELRQVMRENRYDGLEIYEVAELGLEVMANRTA